MSDNPLDGMTSEKWRRLSHREREAICDLSDLTPQLRGLEGWRVEVEDMYGDVRRFIVGRSTGWRPCHLEIKTRRSSGGSPADKEYRRVTPIYKV